VLRDPIHQTCCSMNDVIPRGMVFCMCVYVNEICS
jgi:hypothetical protein